jgi:hypothetical protein
MATSNSAYRMRVPPTVATDASNVRERRVKPGSLALELRLIVFRRLVLLISFVLWTVGLAACGSESGSPPPSPPPSGQPTVSPCGPSSDIAATVRCLPTGSFVWNPPSRLSVGDRVAVTARIGGLSPSALASGLPGPGKPVSGSTPIAEVMAMDLFSDNNAALQVDTIDPQHLEQPIPQRVGDMVAEWNWEVSANKAGNWTLQLRAYVRLLGENVPVQEVKALTQVTPVQVDLSPGQAFLFFVEGNWQWLWTFILVPIAVFAWRRLRSSKGRSDPPPAAPRPGLKGPSDRPPLAPKRGLIRPRGR